MPTPKSVVKFKKGKVEYVSSVDAANYYIFELSRAALRDVGKFLANAFKISFDMVFTKRSGQGRKAIKYKVHSGKNTIYPRVQVGVKAGQKGFYALSEEFGNSKTPRYGLLTNAAQSNIPKILEIESQYLSALNGEAERIEQLINEQEMEGDADGEDR